MSPWLSFKIYSIGLTGLNLAFPLLLIAIYATFEGVTLGDVLGLIAALIVYKTCGYYFIKKDYSKDVDCLREFLNDEEFKELIKYARKKKPIFGFTESLYRTLEGAISLSQQKRDCSKRHTIGCKHYPLTEKKEYPRRINEAIRRGNDPTEYNYYKGHYEKYYRKFYGTLE